MKETRHKIWKFTHDEIYCFIKSTNLKIKNYNFQYYFDYIIQKYNIKVSTYNFHNLILGITMIDNLGISITYQKDSNFRDNFTKCHEIAHVILKHKGNTFTESKNNKNIQELEADFFASFILAPDIVLLHKILYEKKSFQEIINELTLSNHALEIRLKNLLHQNLYISNQKITNLINDFRANKKNKKDLIDHLNIFKSKIIQQYKHSKIDNKLAIQHLINKHTLISEIDFKNISDKQFREKITKQNTNLKEWAYYNKGQTIWFVYNKNSLSLEEALKKIKRNSTS